MKTTVNQGEFIEAFRNYNRYDQFGCAALCALFDYLEDLEADIGEELELDVIGLCCDFTVYESLEAFRKEYGEDYETIEDVENETIVIRVDWSEYDEDGPFIVQAF